MAQLKFYRKSTAPTTGLAAGAIWFNTTDKTIEIYTGSSWEKYAGNLKDATWDKQTNKLSITKHDGSSINLDFTDMASATIMGNMITALDLSADGTYKAHASNYGSGATTVGGEISLIDSALKGVYDLVGSESVATQINNASSAIIGGIEDTSESNTIVGLKLLANKLFEDSQSYTDDALADLTTSVSSETGKSVQVTVSQTNGKIDSVSVSAVDIASAVELSNVKRIAESAQTADEVSTAITNAINALDATVSDEHDPNVKISVTEAEGKLTGVTVTTADIASAATLADVKGKVDAFFAGADISETANQYKDTLKELQTYLTDDAAAAATMAGNIAANKTDVRTLATSTVNGHAIGSVVEDKIVAQTIVLNGSEIKLDGYVKNSATNVSINTTDTINAALGKLEAKADKAMTDASNAAAAGVTSLNGNTGAVTIATGRAAGTIAVGGTDVEVKGLNSAAYAPTTDFATAAQGAKADTAYQKPAAGIPSTDLSTDVNTALSKALNAAPQSTTYTKTEVDNMLAWAEF